MIKTFSPMAARAVARLIAVVVLPTPPFWLATVIIRFRRAAIAAPKVRLSSPLWFAELQNNGVALDNTLMFYQIEVPAAMGRGNLGLVIPAFMEKEPQIRILFGPRR